MRLLVRESLIYWPVGFEYYVGTDPVTRADQPSNI
jgi:hypothetical protein